MALRVPYTVQGESEKSSVVSPSDDDNAKAVKQQSDNDTMVVAEV